MREDNRLLWDISHLAPPWGSRPSIYQSILVRVTAEDAGFTESASLPDEELHTSEHGIRFIPGAFDGIAIFNGCAQHPTQAETAYHALQALTEEATPATISAWYLHLTGTPALDYLDDLLRYIVERRELDLERVHAIAVWLATGAADRDAVKVAIALLGICRQDADLEPLFMLGRHEEFTLYVAVAIRNITATPDPLLMHLASHVTGWGRIHIVERLAHSKDPAIQAWLLRDGCHNSIMDEYTALPCATGGNLLKALQAPHIDQALLDGACDIISALLVGSPGPGMRAYDDGAAATELLLEHIQRCEPNIQVLGFLHFLQYCVTDSDHHDADYGPDWHTRRGAFLTLVTTTLARPGWAEASIYTGLASSNRLLFTKAWRYAAEYGIDAWEIAFERTLAGENYWHMIADTNDSERMDRVLALFTTRHSLDDISDGATTDTPPFGPLASLHWDTRVIVAQLARFPGLGWPLVYAALHCSSGQVRKVALHTIWQWASAQWPTDTETVLREAEAIEPLEHLRKVMTAILAGHPYADESNPLRRPRRRPT